MTTESPTESPTKKYRPSTAADSKKSKAMNAKRWEQERLANAYNPAISEGKSPKELEQETRTMIKRAAHTEAGEYLQACLAKAKRSQSDALRMAIVFDKAYPKEQPDGLTLHVPAKLLANLSVALGINFTSTNQPAPQPVVSQPESGDVPSTPVSQHVDSIKTVQ